MKEALEIRHTDPRTRGHHVSIFKENQKNPYRRNFLLQRVCDDWNSLPENVVDAENVNAFKSLFETHNSEHPMRYNHKAVLEKAARSRGGPACAGEGGRGADYGTSSH